MRREPIGSPSPDGRMSPSPFRASWCSHFSCKQVQIISYICERFRPWSCHCKRARVWHVLVQSTTWRIWGISSLWSHFTNIVHGKAKRHCRGLSSPDATKDIFRDLFSKDQHLPDPSSFFYFCHYSKSSKSISCHASSDWQFPSMGYSLLELQPTPFNTSNTLSRLPGGLFLCETVHHVFRRFERYYNIHFALSVRVLRREWVLYKKVFYMKLQIYKTYGSLTCWWPKLYSRQFHYLLWLVKSVTLD